MGSALSGSPPMVATMELPFRIGELISTANVTVFVLAQAFYEIVSKFAFRFLAEVCRYLFVSSCLISAVKLFSIFIDEFLHLSWSNSRNATGYFQFVETMGVDTTFSCFDREQQRVDLQVQYCLCGLERSFRRVAPVPGATRMESQQ